MWANSKSIGRTIGKGPVLGVIGSTSFHHAETLAACNKLGVCLSNTGYKLVTGGLSGIPESICAGFVPCERIFHLLPFLWKKPLRGTTIRTGLTLYGRRVKLAELCDIYLCVEGGPGTAHEARLINLRGAPMVPLGTFGGEAENQYRVLPKPVWIRESDWLDIGVSGGNMQIAIDAAIRILLDFELTYNRSR